MFYPAKPLRSKPAWLLAASAWAFSVAVPAASAPSPFMLDQPAFDLSGNAGRLFTEAFFLKLGFSFMIGLAMGFALKVAFKIALLIMGLMLFGVFVLQYNGFIHGIDWSGLEVRYDGWIDWLSAYSGAFFGFVGDNLTSAVSFLAGLALGLKF